MAKYRIELITPGEAWRLLREYSPRFLYRDKANIYGCCIKLLTDLEEVKERWEDNFFFMDDNVRSHGRLAVLKEGGEPLVRYDPYTNTAFITGMDYYGWIKSVALAVAGDILEDEHEIYHIHGAAIDVEGCGVAIIAPPGTGKTTHSFGLLRLKGSRLVADDWFFVRLTERGALGFGSEKNSYVEADIGKIWKEYEGLVEKAHLDQRGRAIVNVRWIVGGGGVIPMLTLRKVILLKRDPADPTITRELAVWEGLEYLLVNDFCNPHQLVKDERKLNMRREFFRRLFELTEVYIVNTVKPPHETHAEIVKLLRG
ncbi:MAG: hypothetical protein QW179_04135 [Candidatus Hadarchaeales archaeon]